MWYIVKVAAQVGIFLSLRALIRKAERDAQRTAYRVMVPTQSPEEFIKLYWQYLAKQKQQSQPAN